MAKTRQRRIVKLSDNAIAWLEPYAVSRPPFTFTNFQRDFAKVKNGAKFNGKEGTKGLRAWVYEHAGLEYLRLRTPLRFEYDPNNASDGHPICHAHFLWSHCRCSVVAPLSLGHFVKFIFHHFYPELWQKHAFLREWPTDLGNRTISGGQESILHFACRR